MGSMIETGKCLILEKVLHGVYLHFHCWLRPGLSFLSVSLKHIVNCLGHAGLAFTSREATVFFGA